MKRFIEVLAIVLFLTLGFAGCGGEDMGNLWVDTQGDVPSFIRENEKNLDKLAEMMLAYDFDFYIELSEEKINIIIPRETAIGDERDRLIKKIEDDEKLISYASTLLEFQYIESLDKSSSDGDGIMVCFKPIRYDNGSDVERARYISKEVLNNHPRKEEYLRNFHVVGNWFYMVESRGDLQITIVLKKALKKSDLVGKEHIICELERGVDYFLVRDENGEETYTYCIVTGVDLQGELSSQFLNAGNSFIFYVIDKTQFYDSERSQDTTEYIVDGWDVLYPVKHGESGETLKEYICESDLIDR